MTDKQWNGAIGGGAPPVGNVRIPAKPEPVTEIKPSGKNRVGRIFDQTGDARDISKHERIFAEIAQGNADLSVVVEESRRLFAEIAPFTAASVGEFEQSFKKAIDDEIERMVQAMWRAFMSTDSPPGMVPETRDLITRMAKAARRELRRSAMERRPGGVGFTHPLEFRDAPATEPQPQQSNEEKNEFNAALAAYREVYQTTSRYKLTRADDLTPCWHCGERPALHREFGGAHNHVFIPRPQDNTLTGEDKTALKLDNDALTFAMGGTWMTEKNSVEVVSFDQRCRECGEPPRLHRDGGGWVSHKFVQQRCVICNQPAPYHHVLCGGSRL
jgi:hypothetical protein